MGPLSTGKLILPILEGNVFKHRNGNLYTVLAETHTKLDGQWESSITYKDYQGRIWNRLRSDFCDGKFTEFNGVKGTSFSNADFQASNLNQSKFKGWRRKISYYEKMDLTDSLMIEVSYKWMPWMKSYYVLSEHDLKRLFRKTGISAKSAKNYLKGNPIYCR